MKASIASPMAGMVVSSAEQQTIVVPVALDRADNGLTTHTAAGLSQQGFKQLGTRVHGPCSHQDFGDEHFVVTELDAQKQR